jgi:hypothetical protein
MMPRIFHARWLFALAIALLLCARGTAARVKHNNNWAVIVDTSRFWFNARHASNALTIYRSVRRMGIPDEQVKDRELSNLGGVVFSLTPTSHPRPLPNSLTLFSLLMPSPPSWCRLS